MSKLNAAELLARVRKRKQELQDQPSLSEPAEGEAAAPAFKQRKYNPYLEHSESGPAAAKPRLALTPREPPVRFLDETEHLYLPTPGPPSGREWWDKGPIEISSLVLKPGKLQTTLKDRRDEGVNIHLTPEERRRKRKQERFAKRRDAQERVRLGIDPPPQPKLKLSNVAAVYGPAFVQDPTRYEELARQAEQDRREAHERANRERQLTPEQSRTKHEAQLERHRAQGLHTAVFRVEHLDEDTGKQLFLVDYTAKKFMFTGVALMGSPALIIVEGGEPEILKFTKLLLRKTTGCTLLWTGILRHPQFKLWSLHKFPSEMLKKDLLRNHHALPYYLLMHDASQS